ncbi:hypothetical protein [Pseudomonas phage 98PfluR60PP]|uniref:Uncharacterized protein n=1 Tax=Pseudomonas phage 98PfluR60PP TaxID=2163965 RepID=A0A2S1PFT9_9CAUD|nr:hypothetical protein PP760_gp04 [Pseudomonas phage 98PfluR60PP]AWH15436.1 hypothetical protein [Pseudomonas phage 98PfluR60PP]
MSYQELPTKPEDTPEEILYVHDPKFKELVSLAESLEMSIGNKLNLDTGMCEAAVFYYYPETGKMEHLAEASEKDPIEATRLALEKAIDGLKASQTVH